MGVLATDPLDEIFLVTKLHEFVPDALVFVFQSDAISWWTGRRFGRLLFATAPPGREGPDARDTYIDMRSGRAAGEA